MYNSKNKNSIKSRSISSQFANIDLKKALKLPANVYWKTKEGYFLGCNDQQAEDARLRSHQEWHGSSLYDYLSEEDATTITLNERAIMQEKSTKILIETGRFTYQENFKNKTYLSIKTFLCNSERNVTGIFSVSFCFSDTQLHSMLTKMNQLELININDYFLPIGLQSTQFSQGGPPNSFLPERQAQCLYCLVKGMTAKQIASEMRLSVRTVEQYIDTLKLKLNCNSRSDSITKALT